ncbi:metal-dependent hydrolase [Alicyclobacillus acidoterrestris]|uniref:Metal-dependent hydrolase n=1 Tax=Alicyclobacillus acidoterrestris (strain ATCC 49025 / DSM 3922 / CIP 106132 / NCIMB 13137 / GD3B) TaxID=1356854 RepID=T0D7P2_ALIAG|nr:metal-dependent hydrolase [Alicyclobacillus acidoterrestris]EPZ47507.1 hypothetical protein N007_06105 [Alicyclobacillus acidoterrestris ATCC 49025]UNO48596.1 metal-dependent hydrolase [Alicyclobacillus acidoterrestris]
MDNITHAAFGVGVFATYTAIAGAPEPGAVATAACVAAVVGAEWPDFDLLFQIFSGPVRYLYQHRQISHSIPLWFACSLIVAAIINFVVPVHFWLYAWLSFLGTLTHVGLDLLTAYGTKALWPISKRRFRGDILFVVEPVYLLLFIVGCVLIQLGTPYDATVYAIDGFALLFTLRRVGLRAWLTRRFTRWLSQQACFDGTTPPVWRVLPTIFALPHGYKYVVQQGQRFWFGSFSWKGDILPEAHAESANGNAVQHVLQYSRVGRAMSWFAPMLFVQVEDEGQWTVVHLSDASVRYVDTLPFSATVDLARTAEGNYVVVHEGIRAQPIYFTKLWQDTFRALGKRRSLHIPNPRGYRSKPRV